MHPGFKHPLFLMGLTAALCNCADTSVRDQDDAPRLYRELDDGDLAKMTPVLQRTLETALSGETGRWHNDATNRSGLVQPLRTFRTASGYFCRDFQETITTIGVTESRVCTACRNPDGVWIIALGLDGSSRP